jgi:sterol desaturase/sphingolipid hydroxylase (fatty acid hydroxylase superfamily)
MSTFLLSAAVLSSLYAIVFLVERLPAARFRALPYRRRYAFTDLTWYAVVVGMSAISVLVLRPVFDRIAVDRIAEAVRELPAGGRFAIALLLFDGVSYGVHRGMHCSDLLWNIHKVHHSTLELDGLAATRQHMLENMIRFLPGQIAMYLVGIPTAQVAPAAALGAAFAILTHSNLRVDAPLLERVLITPRLHRRHHVPATSMNNYGGILTLWDKAFGTFVSLDTTADELFGCPGEVDTYPQRFHDAVRRPPRDIAAYLRSRRAVQTADPLAARRTSLPTRTSGGKHETPPQGRGFGTLTSATWWRGRDMPTSGNSGIAPLTCSLYRVPTRSYRSSRVQLRPPRSTATRCVRRARRIARRYRSS